MTSTVMSPTPAQPAQPALESDFPHALPEAVDGAGWIARWGDAAQRQGARLQSAQLQVTAAHPERFGQTSLQVHLDGTYAALMATLAAVSGASGPPAAATALSASATSAASATPATSAAPAASATTAASAAAGASSAPLTPMAAAVVWRQLRLEPSPDVAAGGLTARVELVLLSRPPAVRP